MSNYFFSFSYLFFIFLQINQYSQYILNSSSWNESGQPYISNFSPKEYGENPQNWCIIQDNHNITYIGNSHGLLIYDGAVWQTIKTFKGSTVRSLCHANNRIYIGALSDLGYLSSNKEGTINYVSLLDSLPEEASVFQDVWYTLAVRNHVYFVTSEYIFRHSEDGIHFWKSEQGFHTAFVINDRLFVKQWNTPLAEMKDDSLHLISATNELSGERIYSMLPFSENQILIASRSKGLYLYDGKSLKRFPSEVDSFFEQNQLYNGLNLPGNVFAFATLRGGVVIMDQQGRICRVLNKTTGLRDERVYSLYFDNQEGLWLALNNGVARAEVLSPISLFRAPEGLESSVESLTRHQNKLYAATHLGVLFLDQNRFTPVDGISDFAWTLLNSGDDLLAGTETGLYKINKNKAVMLESDYEIRTLTVSHSDSSIIYAGLTDGLAVFKKEDGRYIALGKAAGIKAWISGIVEDLDGWIWLGTHYEGVIKIHKNSLFRHDTLNQQIMRYGPADGLPELLITPYLHDGRLIFATQKGLRVYDNKNNNFKLHGEYADFLGDTLSWVYRLHKDSGNNLWFIAGSGLQQYNGKSVLQKDGSYQWNNTPFLRINDIGDVFDIFAEPDGVVWFGGSEGIARYDPRFLKDYEYKIKPLIRKVSSLTGDEVFYGGGNIGSNTVIPRESNSLRFDYAFPSYDDVSANMYQVMLSGFDEQWSKWSNETKRDYTGLWEGEYVFKIRAKDIYNNISREASFSFTVLPPWWRTAWAYLFYMILLFTLFFISGKLLRRRVIIKERERAQLIEAQLRAEAAELRIEKAELIADHMIAESERKALELEKARELQLSLIPQNIPSIDNLDIAVYMKTATEVGGDYYDFFSGGDGTITIVLGDATGHGLNAGMMVMATKSLLQNYACEHGITQIFNTVNSSLRNMRLKGIYMGLQVLKLNAYSGILSSAGMPPALIYRSSDSRLEEIVIKSMPLGSVKNFPYSEHKIKFHPGDIIVLMSDGLTERFNESNELLGSEKIKTILMEHCAESSREIIQCFVEIGDQWGGTRLQNDDITLIVIKFN